MQIDPAPSIHGFPKCVLSQVAIVAMTRPISAALSSNRTMKLGGSLLACTADRIVRLPRTRLNALQPNHQLIPSNTAETA